MTLGILLFTYQGVNNDRGEFALRTIRRLRQLVLSPEPVHWHVADDGSHDDYRRKLVETIQEDPGEPGHEVGAVSVSNAAQRGYGASVNLGHRALRETAAQADEHLDAILCVEDDWELQKPINVAPMLRLFDEVPQVGMVRLSYLAYTRPMIGELLGTADAHLWLLLRRDLSEEGFVFSGHPRLEHPGYSATFRWKENERTDEGPWRPGDYELDAAYRLYLRDPGERTETVWPLDFTPASPGAQNYFGHIGSRQSFHA